MAKDKKKGQDQKSEPERPKRDRVAELEKRVTAVEKKVDRIAP